MRYFPVLISLCLLCACGSKTTVILLPEDDGRTGQVIVKNQASETVLDKPYTYTDVTSGSAALKGSPADQKEVANTFQGLIKAEPLKPVHFILYFSHNTTVLTEESLKMIPKVIEMAQIREPSQITVIGHTDTKGSSGYNTQLSWKRARAVAELLESSGAKLNKMTVTSHGENDLLIQTEDNTSEPKNRRVEIMIR